MSRPLIIVTGPSKLLKWGWWAARFQVWRVGLKAHYVHAGAPQIPAGCTGVIIGGGDDIDPKHYGATGTAGANYDAARDKLELDVIGLAAQEGWPILGICRGAQLLNVAAGGSLIEDLRPLRVKTPNRNSMRAVKTAYIDADSRLAAALGSNELRVNSLHHQAIKQAGDGLQIVAHDADNFTQAIESQGNRFVIGVQWHPEYLLSSREQSSLFAAFAKAVGERIEARRSQN